MMFLGTMQVCEIILCMLKSNSNQMLECMLCRSRVSKQCVSYVMDCKDDATNKVDDAENEVENKMQQMH